MKQVDLYDYEVTGILGSGADYEVRAAIERDTGKSVVLKRPEPQMIRRQLHLAIEARTDRMLEAYPEVGQALSTVNSILGYTERLNHDAYFGEALGQDYRILVEERALGIPLTGDAKARFTGVPIGVGQNLFALFPLICPESVPPFGILHQILDVEAAFIKADYLLLDLRPSNIFYQPKTGRITVIDCGALTRLDTSNETSRTPGPGIHDFYLEMLKFYISSEPPPTQAQDYRDPRGLRPVINIKQELEQLAQPFKRHADTTVQEAALRLIENVQQKSYADIDHFRHDISVYTEALQAWYQSLPDLADRRLAWTTALDWLRADYWQRYLFDADTDLATLVP